MNISVNLDQDWAVFYTVSNKASSSSSILISVHRLEFGLHKTFLLRENQCFYSGFSYNPQLFLCNPNSACSGVEKGDNSIASSLNVSLLEGPCLLVAAILFP